MVVSEKDALGSSHGRIRRKKKANGWHGNRRKADASKEVLMQCLTQWASLHFKWRFFERMGLKGQYQLEYEPLLFDF